MEFGYARVSTTAQDLDRQIDALTSAGIERANIFTDKLSGAQDKRPGLDAVLERTRSGDRVTALTLDRLGRNLRSTLNLLHDLDGRGVYVRTMKDAVPVDTASDDPVARMSLLLFAVFAEMERVWINERSAHARAVARAAGRPTGRPRVLSDSDRHRIAVMASEGMSVRAIAAQIGASRSTVHNAIKADV